LNKACKALFKYIIKNLLISTHVNIFRRVHFIHFARHIFLEILKKKSVVARRFQIFYLVSACVVF
jgi:hypothetical protein